MLTLGTLTLDEDPYVSTNYEYSQTSNGTVIGGTKKITLTGTIIKDSPSELLAKSNEIKDWFAQSTNRYISSVSINSQTYSFVVIDNISIDSEDWVYSFAYTITLTAQVETSAVLPSNLLTISYTDYITSLEISESLSISPDKSNTYIFTGNGLHTIQDSVTWEIKMSVACRQTDTLSAIQNAHDILSQILITTPDRAEFNAYKTWGAYLQNRTLETNPTNGSMSFSCKIFLVPPDINASALINIQGSKNHNFVSNAHNATVNLKATGLVAINWSSIIDLPSYYNNNKIINAKSAIDTLVAYYKDLSSFPSQDLIPLSLDCATACNVYSDNICYVSKNISTEKNITEGTMSANIEWSADSNYCENGLSIEIEKTMNITDNTIVEQNNMWVQYPIITNMGCQKVYTESYNIAINSKYNCIDNSLRNIAFNQFNAILNSYSGSTFVLIKKTLQQTNNNCSLSCEFVQQCP